MIFDRKENIDLYKGISGNLDTAIDYLKSHDLSALKEGKYTVDGDNVYFMIQEKDTRVKADAKWEAHHNYMDIQCMLDGVEMLGWQDVKALKETASYNPVKDIVFYDDDGSGSFVKSTSGCFAVFFPSDAHMPLRAADEKPVHVRKVVVKVKV